MKTKVIVSCIIITIVGLVLVLLFTKGNGNTFEDFLSNHEISTVDDEAVSIDNKFTEISNNSDISVMYQGNTCKSDISILLNAGNEIVAKSALYSIETNFETFEIISDYYSEQLMYTVKFTSDEVSYTLTQSMDAIYNVISKDK